MIKYTRNNKNLDTKNPNLRYLRWTCIAIFVNDVVIFGMAAPSYVKDTDELNESNRIGIMFSHIHAFLVMLLYRFVCLVVLPPKRIAGPKVKKSSPVKTQDGPIGKTLENN